MKLPARSETAPFIRTVSKGGGRKWGKLRRWADAAAQGAGRAHTDPTARPSSPCSHRQEASSAAERPAEAGGRGEVRPPMLPSPPLHSGGARGSDPSVAVQISKRLANYTKALHLIDALHKRGDDLIDANTARSPKVDDLRRHVELLRGVLEDSPTMALVKERGPRYTFTQMLHDKERPGMLRQLPGTAMVNYFNSACNALLRGGRAGGELASPAGASPSDADDALPPPSPASPPPLPAEAAGGEAKRKGSEEAKEGRAAKRGRGEGAADGSAHGGTAESLVDAARVLTQMGLDRRMASCNERGGESGNAWGGEPCSVLVDARLYGKM